MSVCVRRPASCGQLDAPLFQFGGLLFQFQAAQAEFFLGGGTFLQVLFDAAAGLFLVGPLLLQRCWSGIAAPPPAFEPGAQGRQGGLLGLERRFPPGQLLGPVFLLGLGLGQSLGFLGQPGPPLFQFAGLLLQLGARLLQLGVPALRTLPREP